MGRGVRAFDRSVAPTPDNVAVKDDHGAHRNFVRGFSLKSTVPGYPIHHAMSVFWAVVFERLRPAGDSAAGTTAAAGLTAAIAYNVDFGVVPTRLSPGFQSTLSQRCLYATYAGFGLALAATTIFRKTTRKSFRQV